MARLEELVEASPEELLELDVDSLQHMLIKIGNELLFLKERLVKVEPEFREIKANIAVLMQVKSVVQSTLRSLRES